MVSVIQRHKSTAVIFVNWMSKPISQIDCLKADNEPVRRIDSTVLEKILQQAGTHSKRAEHGDLLCERRPIVALSRPGGLRHKLMSLSHLTGSFCRERSCALQPQREDVPAYPRP
jgi:hypothetical protein